MARLIDSEGIPDVYSGKKNLRLWKEAENFQKEWKKIQKMMADAFKAKKDATKRERFNKVMEFKDRLSESHHSLPFEEDYLDGIMREIEDFQKNLRFQQEPDR